MPLTYNAALDQMAHNSHAVCKKDKPVVFTWISSLQVTNYNVSNYDYLCLKKLEEAIEKAKKYDELCKGGKENANNN